MRLNLLLKRSGSVKTHCFFSKNSKKVLLKSAGDKLGCYKKARIEKCQAIPSNSYLILNIQKDL
jgi:hypothetical protein